MEKQKEIPVGVIVRKSPNKSPWLKWSWKPVGLLPGSIDQDWKLIREEAGIFEYHAGSKTLELHRAEVESYKAAEEARIKEAEMEAEVERRVAEKMAEVSDAPTPARKSITQTDSTPETPVTKANGLADWLAANLAQRGN